MAALDVGGLVGDGRAELAELLVGKVRPFFQLHLLTTFGREGGCSIEHAPVVALGEQLTE